MSPNTSMASATPEHVDVPNTNDPDTGSDTPSLHPSSRRNCVQGPVSSNDPKPPPYYRNSPPDDPFRDGDARVGYFYPNNKGMQKGLKPATARHSNPPPATTVTPISPIPTANADPLNGEVVLNENPPPLLPPRPSGLSRGLQIPSRVSLITWGFSFPKILPEQGVSKQQWRLFKHELEEFARITISQRLTIIGCELLVGHFVTPILVPVVGWKMRKTGEHKNFLSAHRGGAFKAFEDRWNNGYFHLLGLHVRIEPPGIGNMDGMDITSSKLYKYQQKMGTSSPAPGTASKLGDKKEYRYQYKEGRHRMKATRKCRVIILPYRPMDLLHVQPRITGSENHNGQSTGVIITGAGKSTSVQDFA